MKYSIGRFKNEEAVLSLGTIVRLLAICGGSFGIVMSLTYAGRGVLAGKWSFETVFLIAFAPLINAVFFGMFGLLGYAAYQFLAKRKLLGAHLLRMREFGEEGQEGNGGITQ